MAKRRLSRDGNGGSRSGPTACVPAEDNEDEQEVGERAREDGELRTIEPEDNEARAPGQICERCGLLITASQDVRRLLDGRWVHEWCPVPTGAPGQIVR